MTNRDSPQDDLFLEHVHSPYHRGQAQHAAVCQTARNPFCGDNIELQLTFDQSTQVIEAWHDGNGCITSLAAASILCEHIEGKSLAELKDFSKNGMLSLLGIQLTPLRQQCALVVYNALQQILLLHENESPKPT